MVGEQAELRGIEKGIKGKQGAEDGSGGVAQDAEGTSEEELSHLCPPRHWRKRLEIQWTLER